MDYEINQFYIDSIRIGWILPKLQSIKSVPFGDSTTFRAWLNNTEAQWVTDSQKQVPSSSSYQPQPAPSLPIIPVHAPRTIYKAPPRPRGFSSLAQLDSTQRDSAQSCSIDS